MNKIALAAAAVMTAGTFGLAAIAQDNSSDFQRADGNKDGVVSFEESLAINGAITQDLFNKADANGDGSLDEAEFTSLVTLAAAYGTDASSVPSASSAPVDNTSVGPSSSSAQ
jgi:hypothetical protein